jgi:hypothetical protein
MARSKLGVVVAQYPRKCMSWKDLIDDLPLMAELGEQRFKSEVAYLATVKKDGSPRVHPVTPIIGMGRLFIFMEATSSKGHDLRRDGLYALHSSVDDSDGAGGKFLISGTAKLDEGDETRDVAVQHVSYDVTKEYILFELEVERAFSTVYDDEGTPARERWSREKG